jgi:hypothetical protein
MRDAMSWGAKKVYSQAEPSHVSWPSAFNEQSVKFIKGQQSAGSWNANVPFRYRGWRKLVKFDVMVGDVWFGLNRFFQFWELARYF